MSPRIEGLRSPLTAVQEAVMKQAARYSAEARSVIRADDSTAEQKAAAEGFLADQWNNLEAGFRLGVISVEEVIAVRTFQDPETPRDV